MLSLFFCPRNSPLTHSPILNAACYYSTKHEAQKKVVKISNRPIRKMRYWNVEQDEKLKHNVEQYANEMNLDPVTLLQRDVQDEKSSKHKVDWVSISKSIGKSSKSCRERWLTALKPGIKKGPWSPEEDELLIALVEKHGILH